VATYTEQLAAVQAAIAKAESGQEVTFSDGRRVRRGDLAAMYAERTRLTPLAAREGTVGGGISISRGGTA
jgi:hypothetical protein